MIAVVTVFFVNPPIYLVYNVNPQQHRLDHGETYVAGNHSQGQRKAYFFEPCEPECDQPVPLLAGWKIRQACGRYYGGDVSSGHRDDAHFQRNVNGETTGKVMVPTILVALADVSTGV